MKRERIDKTMSLEGHRSGSSSRIIRESRGSAPGRPVHDGLRPREQNSISYGLGYKKHGDKRHRSSA